MIYISVCNVVAVASGEKNLCNQHQVSAYIPMLPPLVLSSDSIWFVLFLNTHLIPIGFLPACNTFAFDRINQDLCFKKLFTSEVSDLFHNYFSVPFNASSIIFGVLKSPLNSSELKNIYHFFVQF